MNPSTEAKASSLTNLHTINLGYSGFSSDQERWTFLSSLRTFLNPCGQIGFTDNAIGTVTSSTTIPIKIVGTSAAGILSDFVASNGRLTLTAPTARVIATISASVSDGNNHHISLYVAKNGSAIVASKGTHTVSSALHQAHLSSQALVDLVAGDYLEGFVINESAASTVTVTQFSLIAK